MRDEDVRYFRRRIAEERRRAAACVDPAVARIHRSLADHYEAALRGAGIAIPVVATVD